MSIAPISPDRMADMLRREIRDQLETIMKEEIAAANSAITRRINAVADSIALRVLSRYDVRDMGHSLVISVIKIDEVKP